MNQRCQIQKCEGVSHIYCGYTELFLCAEHAHIQRGDLPCLGLFNAPVLARERREAAEERKLLAEAEEAEFKAGIAKEKSVIAQEQSKQATMTTQVISI